MSSRTEPLWVDELLAQAGWLRRIAGELVAGDLADDVAQEVWVASLRNPPGDRGSPRAWLRTVASNLVRSGFRSDRRRQDREAQVEEPRALSDSPEDLVARMELQRFLAEQILALDEPYRQTVILRYLEGRSAADIARALDVPPGTVRRRLKVGLDRLRAALDSRSGRARWLRALAPLVPVPGGALVREPRPPGAGALRVGAALVFVSAGATAVLWWALARPPAGAQLAGSQRPAPSRMPAFVPSPLPEGPTPEPAEEPAEATGGALARLEDGAVTLEGRVLDAEGGAIPGAVVITWLPLPGVSRRFPRVAVDGQGHYRLALPPGRYGVGAIARGYGRADTWVEIAGRHTLDLRLHPAARLSGRVLERASGRPVAEAAVTVVDGQERTRVVAADAAGAFEVEVAAGRHTVWARRGALHGAAASRDVRPAEAIAVEVVLERASPLRGRLLSSGRVGGLTVTATTAGEEPECRGGSATATSSADGSFALEGVPACAVELSVAGGGAAPATARLPRGSGDRWIEIALAPEARLVGRVLGAGGPASQARISARISADGHTPAFRTVATDADGRFELGGLAAGEVWLVVEGSEAGTASLVERLAAGERREVTAKLSAPATISGRVVYPDGAAAPGVRLEASNVRDGARLGVRASAVSAADGAFSVGPLAEGPVSLRVGSAWYGVQPGAKPQLARSQELSVGAGEHRTGLLFTVPRAGGELDGMVMDADGRPAAGAMVDVFLEDANGRTVDFQARVFSDEAGAIALPNLFEGTYRLRATHPTLGSGRTRRAVPAAAPFTLQLSGSSSRQ